MEQEAELEGESGEKKRKETRQSWQEKFTVKMMI